MRLAPVPADPEEALAPYVPGEGSPWDRRLAAHLLRRGGFGGTPEEIERAFALGPAAAARELVDAPPDPALRELDEGIDTLADFEDPWRLRAWWALRILRTKAPLRDKQALFFHGHFATGYRKVRSMPAMLGQVRLFLDGGLGSFRKLAHAVARDPAMLVYLDGATSNRLRPNENFARELMELFTLGRGSYEESDVREAARAFTGWRIEGGKAQLFPSAFDAGEKSVLGKRGALTADDIVDLCVDHPACARRLARRLLVFYVQPAPSEPVVAAVAERIRASGFELAPVLQTIFASQLFYSESAYRSCVKSPVEFAAGTLRALGGGASGNQLGVLISAMGQSLFDPPGVKGWDGGLSWIHTATWIERAQFAAAAVYPGRPLERKFDPASLFEKRDPQVCVDRVLDLLLQGDVPPEVRTTLVASLEAHGCDDDKLRGMLYAALLLPEFHVA